MRRLSKCQVQAYTDKRLAALAETLNDERLDRSFTRRRKARTEAKSVPPPHEEIPEERKAEGGTYVRRMGELYRSRGEGLLSAARARVPELEALLERMNGHWFYIDRMYRFYHHSLKVFWIQDYALEIRDALQKLLPDRPLNYLFREVVWVGTGRIFDMKRTNKG